MLTSQKHHTVKLSHHDKITPRKKSITKISAAKIASVKKITYEKPLRIRKKLVLHFCSGFLSHC